MTDCLDLDYKITDMKPKHHISIFTLAGALSFPSLSYAEITLTVQQQGSDVVIDYSGSWDNWARHGTYDVNDRAVYGLGLFNASGADLDFMGPMSGMSLASGSRTNLSTSADSVTGDELGWNDNFTYAPLGYTAGDTLTGSMTFNNTDLATMGFTPGDSGSWSGGAGTANFTVSAGSGVSAVPEPSSSLGLAGLILGSACWRRSKRA